MKNNFTNTGHWGQTEGKKSTAGDCRLFDKCKCIEYSLFKHNKTPG